MITSGWGLTPLATAALFTRNSLFKKNTEDGKTKDLHSNNNQLRKGIFEGKYFDQQKSALLH